MIENGGAALGVHHLTDDGHAPVRVHQTDVTVLPVVHVPVADRTAEVPHDPTAVAPTDPVTIDVALVLAVAAVHIVDDTKMMLQKKRSWSLICSSALLLLRLEGTMRSTRRV